MFAFAGAVMVAVVGEIYQTDRATQAGIPSAMIVGALLTVLMVGLLAVLLEVAFVLSDASDVVSNGEEDEGDGDEL